MRGADLLAARPKKPKRKPKRNSRDRPIASAADWVEVIPKFELLALPFGVAKSAWCSVERLRPKLQIEPLRQFEGAETG